MNLSRRDFLQLGAAGVGVFAWTPNLFAAAKDAAGPALENDHVLVLLQLSGERHVVGLAGENVPSDACVETAGE